MYENIIMRAVTLCGNKQQKEGEKEDGEREEGEERKDERKKKESSHSKQLKIIAFKSGCSSMQRMQ